MIPGSKGRKEDCRLPGTNDARLATTGAEIRGAEQFGIRRDKKEGKRKEREKNV